MIAGDIKSLDAEEMIKRCPFVGNVQEYIIPSTEESHVIARKWL